MGYVVKTGQVMPYYSEYGHRNLSLEGFFNGYKTIEEKLEYAKEQNILFDSISDLEKNFNQDAEEISTLDTHGKIKLYKFGDNDYAYSAPNGIVLGFPDEAPNTIDYGHLICRITKEVIGRRKLYPDKSNLNFIDSKNPFPELKKSFGLD